MQEEDEDQSDGLVFFKVSGVAPTAFPYNSSSYANPTIVMPLAAVTLIAFIANASLALYIFWHKLYHNFISSHFIAHLCMTNMFGLGILMPMFLVNLWMGTNIWASTNAMCRLQTFLMCSEWAVIYFMTLCIAGVHLLTFARIHYNQMFCLLPSHLCLLSWIVAFAISLPCLTNNHIVIYDPVLRHCMWGSSDYSYKFLTYLLILCVFIPSLLFYYAYIKVLKILYHSPIVFQSIGLYKSRFLVYAFLLGPFFQAPFFFVTMSGTWRFRPGSLTPILSMFLAYAPSLVSPLLYGLSLVQMKEEDMALTARAQKNMNAYQHVAHTPGHNL
uniref:G-protein coupled receptors family 1 profile domain-containing protein n=1 Tax=Ditylenchus dipsaci TaxID=166011 RepID=A0A915E4A2_9BILA